MATPKKRVTVIRSEEDENGNLAHNVAGTNSESDYGDGWDDLDDAGNTSFSFCD